MSMRTKPVLVEPRHFDEPETTQCREILVLVKGCNILLELLHHDAKIRIASFRP